MVSGENSPAEEMGVNCSRNRNENEACWLGEKSLNWGSGRKDLMNSGHQDWSFRHPFTHRSLLINL